MFWPPDRIGRAGGATTIFTDAVLADPGRVLRGGGVGLDVLAVCWTVSPTAVASAACMLTRSGCLRVLALGRHSQCPVSDGWCGLDRDEQQIESADRRCHGPEPTGHPNIRNPVHGHPSTIREPNLEHRPMRPRSARHAGPGRTELRVPHPARRARSRDLSTEATTLHPRRLWRNRYLASGPGVPSSPGPPSRAYRPDLGRLCEPTSSRSSRPGLTDHRCHGEAENDADEDVLRTKSNRSLLILLSMALLRCCAVALLRCCAVALLRCCAVALLRCCAVALLRCCAVALLRCCAVRCRMVGTVGRCGVNGLRGSMRIDVRSQFVMTAVKFWI